MKREIGQGLPAALVAAAGLGLAGARWVTARHVPVDWTTPSYGFPLPWFAFSDVSSLEWNVALGPLVVDWMVYTGLLAPAFAVLFRWVPAAGQAVIAGAAAWIGGMANAGTVWLLALGVHYPYGWRLPSAGWEIECRSLWVGEPEASLDVTDPGDPCVRQQERR